MVTKVEFSATMGLSNDRQFGQYFSILGFAGAKIF